MTISVLGEDHLVKERTVRNDRTAADVEMGEANKVGTRIVWQAGVFVRHYSKSDFHSFFLLLSITT